MNWKAFFVSRIKGGIFNIIVSVGILCLVFFIADLCFGLFPGLITNEVEEINDSTYMTIRTKHYVNCLGDTMRVKTDTLYRHGRPGVVLTDIPAVEIREKREVIGDTTRVIIDTIQTDFGTAFLNMICESIMEYPSDSIRAWINDSANNNLQELIQTLEECAISNEKPNPLVDSALRHLKGLD